LLPESIITTMQEESKVEIKAANSRENESEDEREARQYGDFCSNQQILLAQ
jgi:hypothetical protein